MASSPPDDPRATTAFTGEPITGTMPDLANTGQFAGSSSESSALVERSVEARARFTLIKLHAQGGLGAVSVGHDECLNRTVAIKEIRPEVDSVASRQRFLREAEITAQLEHPGIVPIYAISHDDHGRPYYAMRFIRGRTLAQAIEAFHHPGSAGRFSTLDFRSLLQRFINICQTVAFAHSRRVIHRDLKPANVMLGEFGETLVLDWGLAKQLDSEDDQTSGESPQDGTASSISTVRPSPAREDPRDSPVTEAGQVVGTLAYMSPEQAAGREVGAGTDVFALGAILYELLTGVPPYSGTAMSVLLKVTEADIEDPSQKRSDIPRPLEAVCKKALRRTPQERYASPAELAAEVERWLADEPVRAQPEPWTDHVRRWAKRHRTAATAAIVMLLVGSLGLAGGLFAVQREKGHTERRRLEAVRARDDAIENLALANENFQLARDAVDTYCVAVGDQFKALTTEHRSARKSLLASAVQFYQQFVTKRRDDPTLESERARAIGRLAMLEWETGQEEKALEHLSAARALLANLGVKHPDVASYQEDLATVLQNLAVVSRDVGRFQDAVAATKEAVQLRRSLADQRPGDTEALRNLAQAQKNHAATLQIVGRLPEAEEITLASIASQQRLLEGEPANPTLRHDLALARLNLGPLYLAMQKLELAETAILSALSEFDALARNEPNNQDLRQHLEFACINASNILRRINKVSDAEKLVRRALEISTQLQRESPTVPGYRKDHARNLYALALVLGAQGKTSETEDALRSSLKVRSELAAEFPGVVEYQWDLASIYQQLGNLYSGTSRADEAEKAVREAIRLQTQIRRSEMTPDQFLDMAGSYLNLANLMNQLRGKPADALTWYDRATEALEAPVQEFSRNARMKEVLRNAHWGKATAARTVGQLEVAVRSWERALALGADKSLAAFFRTQRALDRIALNQVDEAIADVEPMARDSGFDPATYFNLATVFAQASHASKSDATRSDRWATRAIEMLHLVRDRKVFDSTAGRDKLTSDKMLDPIRNRPEFQQLLQDVAPKK